MKEGVPYWSCTPQPGCYSIVVLCRINDAQRIMYNGFYALPRLRYDSAGALQQRLMRLEAMRILTRDVLAAIRKEVKACKR